MILFLDFETTGLPTASSDFMAQPGVCQIGAVLEAETFEEMLPSHGMVSAQIQWKLGNREAASFYSLVNPEFVTWSEGAMKVHGMTPDTVKDAPTMFEIGPALARFALGCRAWGGYNTKFDKDILWYQLLKYGLERSFPWPPEDIDVMKIAGKILEQQGKRGLKRPKLSEAYEAIVGGKFANAHDALADIRATVEVWRKISATADAS